MFAVISRSDPDATPALQRATGFARIGVKSRADGASCLADLYQQGSYKVRLPRGPGDDLEATLINTAGGATGGDAFSCEVVLDQGARAIVTTPASEKVYRSAGGETRIEARLYVAGGGRLAWLPQETILFDGACLRRRLEADLAPDAELLIAEAFVFGRTAMGEALAHGSLRDDWRIRRDGRLIFAEAARIGPDFAPCLGCPSVLSGHLGVATIVLARADAGTRLDDLRVALDACSGVTAGASVIGEVMVARIAAIDGLALRRALVAALGVLREGALPRAWFC